MMTIDFTTQNQTRALEYIRLHLEEGYNVSAYAENAKGTECMKIYKIKVEPRKGGDTE